MASNPNSEKWHNTCWTLDIDGDVCHHVHNAVKKFSTCVDPTGVLNKLLDDIFNDLDYSADLREDLKKICSKIGKDEKLPIKRAGHRWLSIYDLSVRFVELLEALTIFYSVWLTHEEKREYEHLSADVLKDVNKHDRVEFFAIQSRLKKKKMTTPGKERKRRITLCNKI